MSDLIYWYAPWSGRLLVGAIVLLALVGSGWALLWRRRLKSPHCPHCGYSMTAATSTRCPECGGSSTLVQQLRGRRRWRLALGFMAIAIVVPGLVAARRIRQYGWDYYLTFGPGHYFFGHYTLDRVAVNGVNVRVIGDRSRLVRDQQLEIRSSQSTNTTNGVHWFIGDSAVNGSPVGRGEDITGDGRPNIVIREYSGGAHCCTTYVLYEVWPTGVISELTRLDAQNGGGFEDRDGDGFPEFILPDWTWAYELTCYACLRYPQVILKFDGKNYAPSADLMLEPEPAADYISTWLQQAERDQATLGNDVSSSMMRDQIWGEMLRLIYVGHANTAWALLDAAWNDAWGDKDANLARFTSIMHKSQFWPLLKALNGGALE